MCALWTWTGAACGGTMGRVCGIAGLFAKTPAAQARLGRDLAAMLEQLSERGPDSAGVSIYRDPLGGGANKVSLLNPAGVGLDWGLLAGELSRELGDCSVIDDRGDQAVLAIQA